MYPPSERFGSEPPVNVSDLLPKPECRARSPSPSPPPAQSGIDAERPRAGSEQVKEDETEQDGALATVQYRPERAWRMRLEVGHRHFAGEQERHWPSEEPEHDERPAEHLQYPSEPHLREHLGRAGPGPFRAQQ